MSPLYGKLSSTFIEPCFAVGAVTRAPLCISVSLSVSSLTLLQVSRIYRPAPGRPALFTHQYHYHSCLNIISYDTWTGQSSAQAGVKRGCQASNCKREKRQSLSRIRGKTTIDEPGQAAVCTSGLDWFRKTLRNTEWEESWESNEPMDGSRIQSLNDALSFCFSLSS